MLNRHKVDFGALGQPNTEPVERHHVIGRRPLGGLGVLFRRPASLHCRRAASFSISRGLLGPDEQFMESVVLRRAGHYAFQGVGEVGLRINAVHRVRKGQVASRSPALRKDTFLLLTLISQSRSWTQIRRLRAVSSETEVARRQVRHRHAFQRNCILCIE